MPETKRRPARAAVVETVDCAKEPLRYRIGRGEQGIFHTEPYKSEMLPLWRFRTPDVAQTSADALYAVFEKYRGQKNFVGMDMARKFIQMGVTRSRRYANHAGGRKFDSAGAALPASHNADKARSAAIFLGALEKVRADATYLRLKKAHQMLQAAQEAGK